MDKADKDDSTPARITRAPAPIRPIRFSTANDATVPPPMIYEPAKPPTPPTPLLEFLTPPPGFVVFAHIPSVLPSNADRWGVLPGRVPAAADLRAYARAITAPLALGETQAAGIDANTGAIVWAPHNIWRTSSMFKTKREGAAFLALSGQSIQFGNWRADHLTAYPILTCRALAQIFGAETPPDEPPRSVLAGIQEVERKGREVSQAEPIEAPTNRGRKPSQNMWEPFWIEVALWAAKNDLTPAGERRLELRRHMQAWAAGPTSPRPSDTSIDRALRSLFSRVVQINLDDL